MTVWIAVVVAVVFVGYVFAWALCRAAADADLRSIGPPRRVLDIDEDVWVLPSVYDHDDRGDFD